MQLHARGEPHGLAESVVGRITTRLDVADRREHVFLVRDEHEQPPPGYAGVLATTRLSGVSMPCIEGVAPLNYLDEGDVVAMYPSGVVQVVHRRASPHNSILLTERCNSLCLMCSQPPRAEDDSWRVPIVLRALDLIDPTCRELGFTGGEPTLLGDSFFAIIDRAKSRLPNTALHILTNGRLFKDALFAARLGEIGHPDLMLGIPLYSDIDTEHDFVVQAVDAYDETVEGLYNLAEHGVAIELRVVVHASTYQRLPRLAEFIARNLPFVSHVALMGLEMFGYVHLNMSTVWIDPIDYQDQLEDAVSSLALNGIEPVIYNHQLCGLGRSLWPFAVKSISDWKNVYLPQCDSCAVRSRCGGFFHSGTKRYSRAIQAITAEI